MKKNKLLIWGGILTLVVIFATVVLKNRQLWSHDAAIHVGVVLPLSGEMSSYGVDCRDGIKHAFESMGKQFDLSIYDSKGEPKTAASICSKLIDIDCVDLIIGDMFSSTTLAMSSIANKTKTILLSPTASSREIPQAGIYSLSVFPPETFEADMVADFVKAKYAKPAVLFEKVAASEAMANEFKSKFDGGVIFESFDSDLKDFRNIVHKLDRSGSDIVFLVTYKNNAIKIIHLLKELDIAIDIVGQSALYDPEMLSHLKNIKFNFYLTGPAFSTETLNPGEIEIVNEFKGKYNKDMNQMSVQGFIAATVGMKLLELKNSSRYVKGDILGIKTSILGVPFRFADDMTSCSGLSLYKVDSGKFVQMNGIQE